MESPVTHFITVILCMVFAYISAVDRPDAVARLADKAEKIIKALDYHRHMSRLEKKLAGTDFHIVLQKPFVVIGDEPIEHVKHRAEKTVKWAVDLLKKDFFEKDPGRILDIWLFRDKESYERNTQTFFGEKPGTPYGYYSHTHGALIMNISTGGGTLVHEIVHPFMEANFPGCPSWFDEGLASLYEQCGERDGKITGFTNWRLAGLQEAIAEDRVPSFKALCSTTTFEFYQQDRGTNYGQARYLCYYLQEKGLLRKYYHAFRKNAHNDPTGYDTLMKVLEITDMDAFQKHWEEFVMGLKYR